jgi:hypothetical protein
MIFYCRSTQLKLGRRSRGIFWTASWSRSPSSKLWKSKPPLHATFQCPPPHEIVLGEFPVPHRPCRRKPQRKNPPEPPNRLPPASHAAPSPSFAAPSPFFVALPSSPGKFVVDRSSRDGRPILDPGVPFRLNKILVADLITNGSHLMENPWTRGPVPWTRSTVP